MGGWRVGVFSNSGLDWADIRRSCPRKLGARNRVQLHLRTNGSCSTYRIIATAFSLFLCLTRSLIWFSPNKEKKGDIYTRNASIFFSLLPNYILQLSLPVLLLRIPKTRRVVKARHTKESTTRFEAIFSKKPLLIHRQKKPDTAP